MSRFYGTLWGSGKTSATKSGTVNNPSKCHVRGWDIGGQVNMEAHHDADIVHFYLTGGSNGVAASDLLLSFQRNPDGELKLVGVGKWLAEQLKK